jgi:hypothetical protein
MLYERGPLTLLPESVFPRLVARRDFEALASAEVSALESHALSLGISASAVASALGSSTQGLEGLELAAASHELAHQPSDLDSSVGGAAASADLLERELGGLMGELPRTDVGMPQPDSHPPAGGELPPGTPFPGPGPITPSPESTSPRPAPQPSPPPPPAGDLYDGSDAAQVLKAYAERNSNERSRIEAFLRANPRDWHRAPGALGLPGWMEFYERWQRGEL